MDKLDNEIHICEHCGKEHDGSYGSGRFCSKSCAHARHHSTETKCKISNSLRLIPITFCKDCGKQLERRNKSGYCNKCVRKYINNKPEIIEKQRNSQLKLVANGKHQGWKSRNITSYPEQFWKQVLSNNHIKYEFNYSISKRSLGLSDNSNYFLDFRIGSNVDLEIDGKQHQYNERKEHDKIRDETLISHGWKVYRIPWNEINSESGKLQMKKKIDDFLNWLNIQ